MELKLTKTKLKFDVYGDTVECVRPSLKDTLEMEQKMKECKDDSQKIVEVILDFLSKQGFSKSLLESMEMGHLMQVIEVITGKKNDSLN